MDVLIFLLDKERPTVDMDKDEGILDGAGAEFGPFDKRRPIVDMDKDEGILDGTGVKFSPFLRTCHPVAVYQISWPTISAMHACLRNKGVKYLCLILDSSFRLQAYGIPMTWLLKFKESGVNLWSWVGTSLAGHGKDSYFTNCNFSAIPSWSCLFAFGFCISA